MFPDELLISLLGEQISKMHRETDKKDSFDVAERNDDLSNHIRELKLIRIIEVDHIAPNVLAKGVKKLLQVIGRFGNFILLMA